MNEVIGTIISPILPFLHFTFSTAAPVLRTFYTSGPVTMTPYHIPSKSQFQCSNSKIELLIELSIMDRRSYYYLLCVLSGRGLPVSPQLLYFPLLCHCYC